MEKPNTRIKLSAPFLTIIPTVHFLVQLIKRSFDLTAIIPAYIYLVKNIKDIKTEEVFEFDIGRSTIVCSMDEKNRVWLITGWNGSRENSSLNHEEHKYIN